jgi:hypothetical protein
MFVYTLALLSIEQLRLMTHNTIVIALALSVLIGIPLGIVLMVLWIKKIFKKVLGSKGPLEGAVLIYAFPGLVVLIVCSIPAFYFNYLLKQEDYCQQLVKVNPRMTKDDPALLKRCGALDIDALYKASGR